MKRLFTALLGMALGSGAVAQGLVSVGVSDGESYIFGDFSLRYEQEAVALEFGMFGTVGRLHETYAALSFGTTEGRLQVGFPMPAYDRFAPSQMLQFHPASGLSDVGISRSRATHGAMTQPKYLPYGATYIAPDWAASVHGVPDYNTTIYGAAGQWHMDNVAVFAAAEVVQVGEAFDVNAKVTLRMNQVSASYFNPHANGLDDYWELAVDVPVSDRLKVHTAVLSPVSGDATDLGLSAHYDLHAQMGVDLGVVWQSDHARSVALALTQHF